MTDNKIGPNRGAGRPKGAKNKTTVKLKEAIMNALNEAGGEEYLLKVAREDPRTFCGLLGKVLPMQVTGEDGGAVAVSFAWLPPQS